MKTQNENTSNLTRDQMEKVTGGGDIRTTDDGTNFGSDGLNCFCCTGTRVDGTPCGQPLEHISGRLYRCTNPLCNLFAKDQYPGG